MKRFAALFLIVVFLSAPALAQQNFFLKKHLNTNIQQPQGGGAATAPDEAPATAAPSTNPTIPINGTKITNAQANSYYDNCLQQKNANFTDSGKQMLCACTAAQMQKELSVEEIQAMQNNTPEGQAAKAKMTMFVYAPCLKYPTHDLIYTRCMNTPQIKAAVPNPENLCKCMGDGMGSYMEEKGPQELMAAMQKNPNDTDPLGTLMSSPEFDQQSQTIMQSCAGQNLPQ